MNAVAVVLVPAIGALICLLPRAARAAAALACALVIGLAAYAIAAPSGAVRFTWAAPLAASFGVALDPVSALFVIVCAIATLAGVGASARVPDQRAHFALICAALTSATTVLVARDLALLFAGWESLLVSVAVLARQWGDAGRRAAAPRLAVHGLVGSGLFLVALASMAASRGTLNMDALAARPIAPAGQLAPALLFLAAFTPALSLFPFHGWAPRAYAAAPSAAACLIAGCAAPVALYGVLRVCVGLLPDGVAGAAPVLIALAAVGAVYAALLASRQDDMRRGIAYLAMSLQSVAALAIFAATPTSLRGGIVLGLANAIAIVSLIAIARSVAERTASFSLARAGGLAASAPMLAAVASLAAFAAVAVPGSPGFAGLVLALSGMYQRFSAATVVVAIAVVIDAVWAAAFLRRAFHGPPLAVARRDLSWRERAVIVPLLAVTLAVGVAPRIVTDLIGDGVLPSVEVAP